LTARDGTITSKVYVQYSYDREKRDALNTWGARVAQIVADAPNENVVQFPARASES
jgi:hypothetical protein